MPERTIDEIRELAGKLDSDIDTLTAMIENRRKIKDLRKELAALKQQRVALRQEAADAVLGGE